MSVKDWTTEPHVWGRKGDPRTFMQTFQERVRELAACTYCAGSGRVMMGSSVEIACEACHGYATRRLTFEELTAFASSIHAEGMEAAAKIAESQVDSYNKAGQWIAEAIRKAAKGK